MSGCWTAPWGSRRRRRLARCWSGRRGRWSGWKACRNWPPSPAWGCKRSRCPSPPWPPPCGAFPSWLPIIGGSCRAAPPGRSTWCISTRSLPSAWPGRRTPSARSPTSATRRRWMPRPCRRRVASPAAGSWSSTRSTSRCRPHSRGKFVWSFPPATAGWPTASCRARGEPDSGRGPCPWRHPQEQAGRGAQRHGGPGLWVRAGFTLQPEAPGDGGEQQGRFHHGEALPDAHARAAAEWEKGEAGQRRRFCALPALRPEGVGVREEGRKALHRPLAGQQQRPGGNCKVPEAARAQGSATGHPERGVQAQRLLDDGLRVRQAGQVVRRRGPVPQRLAEFRRQPPVRRRAGSQQQKGPGQCECRAFVAGGEESLDLLAQGAMPPRPRPQLEQHRRHAPLSRVGAGDQPVHEPVQPPHGRRLARRGGQRQQAEEAMARTEALHQRVHDRADLGGLRGDVRAQQGCGDDLQGQASHVPLDVSRLAKLPIPQHPLRQGGDGPAIVRHHFGMERRLAGPPLSPPGVPVAGDQAVPQQAADGAGPQPHGLDEVPVVRDQHPLDVCGIPQQEGAQERQAQGDDRAIPTDTEGQKAERVPPQCGQVAQQRVSRRGKWRRHGVSVPGTCPPAGFGSLAAHVYQAGIAG